MKQFALLTAVAPGLMVAECGSNDSNPVNGTWNATLLANNSSTVFAYRLCLWQRVGNSG